MSGERMGRLNGRAVPVSALVLPATERAARLGLGVFETALVTGGRAPLLSRHAARMDAGLRTLGLAPSRNIAERVHEGEAAIALAAIGEGVLRMIAAASPTEETEGFFAAWAEPRAGAAARQEMTAITLAGGRRPGSPLAGVKALSYAEYDRAWQRARNRGCDEALLVDESGRLLEGARSNLFLVRGGALETPALDSGILPGVVRGVVLEIARGLGWTVRETEIPGDALRSASEAMLTNALIGVASLVRVDGRPVGSGGAGPKAAQLRAEWTAALSRSHG